MVRHDRDPIESCDPVDLCVRRYPTDVLYQKAWLILDHRVQCI